MPGLVWLRDQNGPTPQKKLDTLELFSYTAHIVKDKGVPDLRGRSALVFFYLKE